ncbi:MAG: type IV pilus twitching motility protein PilT [Planctomycetota bacterium]|nr:MAG: type IV pilus twitching motility protein PilT [Planctomycetota bacterium]
MARVDIFLEKMKEVEASDLHLSTGYPPLFRIYGELRPVVEKTLTAEVVEQALEELMPPFAKRIFKEELEVDFSYTSSQGDRFRVNVFCQQNGISAVFRRIPQRIPTLEELELPTVLEKIISHHTQGLILVTGATGSGKSTTLAAMLNYINQRKKLHIITLEDPIEFLYPVGKCLINQREVGSHTRSFAQALRAALREDPDIILVGEIRDLETMELAITAANTGHLVLGTLHTSSAAQTVDRIIHTFPSHQQEQIRVMLSESILAVISQRLLPRCDRSGLVPALEILVVHTAVSNVIRENKTYQLPSLIQTGKKYGMQTLDQALWDLFMLKKISSQTAYRHAQDKSQFASLLGK